ncbi:DUF6382 domain-containing protein [Gorillibacterium sp. CAU 1737]|uniref:DUF6382 domain-containing protein n=1 Tax=Gorillibacterium sp. CAU 1737 TaxID=3140362 RepID=UPI0032618F4B
MTVLHGVNWDRIDRSGHYVAVSRGTSGFLTEEINRTERIMLERHRIQGLLPLVVEEEDLELRLYYACSGLRPLAQELRFHPLEEEDLARLIVDLVFVLENGRAHLLQDHRFVLDLDQVYLSHETKSPELVYLPLRSMDEEEDFQSRWHKLISAIREGVKDTSGQVLRVLDSLLQHKAHPMEYKKGLLSALKQSSKLSVEQEGLIHPHQRKIPTSLSPSTLTESSLSLNKGGEALGSPKSFQSPAGKGVMAQQSQATPTAQQAPSLTLSDKQKLILIVPVLLSWGLFAWFAAEWLLFAALGITVFAVSVGYHLSKGQTKGWKEPLSPNPLMESDHKGQENVDRQKKPKAASSPIADPGSARPPAVDFMQEPLIPSASIAAASGQDSEYFATLSSRTVLLFDPKATVLLKQPDSSTTGCRAYLEWNKPDAAPVRIPIKEEGLVIGRETLDLPFSSDTKELSRQHCELLHQDGTWIIRDLGSKNGTQVNGSPLIPYKEYPLEQGDQLELARLHFRFQK